MLMFKPLSNSEANELQEMMLECPEYWRRKLGEYWFDKITRLRKSHCYLSLMCHWLVSGAGDFERFTTALENINEYLAAADGEARDSE